MKQLSMAMKVSFDPMKVSPKDLADKIKELGVAEGDIEFGMKKKGAVKVPVAAKSKVSAA
jgi:hypothetical protein